MRKMVLLVVVGLLVTGLAGCSLLTPSKVEVRITDSGFDPSEVTVRAGGTVEWTNGGTTLHTVTAKDGSFDSAAVDQGTTFPQMFEEEGVHEYYCRYHVEETGVVTVR